MKRRRRGANGRRVGGVALFVLLALVLPVSVNMLRGGVDIPVAAGERLAAIAVVANMPEAGLYLLVERLRSEFSPPGRAPALEIYMPALPQAPPPPSPLPALPPAIEEALPYYREAAGSLRPLIRPRIPVQYQATLLSENLSGSPGGQVFHYGAGLIRNDTRMSVEYVRSILDTPHNLSFSADGGPQVLIYHTHATEAFERWHSDIYDIRNTWRSNDNNINIVAVGAVLAQVLEENGIAVVHNSTQHDYPSHNRSYERSAQTISYYLERYPSIRIALDLHRDALERDNRVIVKPVVEIDGQLAAQVMILIGCDNGNLNMPHWRENFRFAAALQDAIETAHPQLSRPAWLKYRRYNQHLSPGALLLEIGSNANTLEEAIFTATLLGDVLVGFINDNMED